MTKTRYLWALIALAFTLVLAACSTPEDLKSGGGLEAQFGSPYDEKSVDVAFVSSDRIYVLLQQYYETVNDYGITEHGGLWLRRLDGNGKIIWNKQIAAVTRQRDPFGAGESLRRSSLVVDPQGNVNVLSQTYSSDGGWEHGEYIDVQKFNPSGTYLSGMQMGGWGLYIYPSDVAVDASGDYYLGLDSYWYDAWNGEGGDYEPTIAKYSPTGEVRWKRVPSVGFVNDIALTSNGMLLVAGSKGVARYTTSGNLVWTKVIGPLDNVVMSGSSIYTRRWKDVRKFDLNGKQLWLKSQTGLNTIVLQDMASDGSGNVYLSGKYAASSGNMNAMVRKLNSSGAVLWTKTYGTPVYDDALSIATITGGEIYTAGVTLGSLAHTNIGGLDGYIRKLNSAGNPIWTK